MPYPYNGSVEKALYFINAQLNLLIGRHKAALYVSLQSYRVATGLVSVGYFCYKKVLQHACNVSMSL